MVVWCLRSDSIMVVIPVGVTIEVMPSFQGWASRFVASRDAVRILSAT